MYVDDIRNDFFKFLTGKRVFLMVHYDIDSICCCKILQTLLRDNHTLYSLAIIRGIEDFKTAFRENCEDVKYFVLINCGAGFDIVELLEPEEDIVFFVLDSHRPIDLCNIYSNGQIRLLSPPEEEAQVPEFHSVFREESDDEDYEGGNSDDADSGDERTKRRRLDEDAIMKRRDRRLWEENRNKLLFEYSQFSYYAKASSLHMFDLAWKLNRDDKDLLWLAIIALTEQMLLGKLEEMKYNLEISTLQAHATRLHNRCNDAKVKTSLKISFEKDLRLVLHRHWTVNFSLKFSPFTACRLKLWTIKGERKLLQLLAEMGMPLAESRQLFNSMDMQLKKEFHSSLEKISEKYNLEDIVFPSFMLRYGFRNVFSASDVVYSLLAVLETSVKAGRNVEDCFHSVIECIPRLKEELLETGISRTKILTKTIFRMVQAAIDMKQVMNAGPFIYYIIQEGSIDSCLFSNQDILRILANFILNAYVSMSRNRKASTLPLIVSVTKDSDRDVCLVLGIPPLCENSPKSFFGKAFEQAAEKIHCDSNCDFFDTSYFELQVKDRAKFLDALAVLLS